MFNKSIKDNLTVFILGTAIVAIFGGAYTLVLSVEKLKEQVITLASTKNNEPLKKNKNRENLLTELNLLVHKIDGTLALLQKNQSKLDGNVIILRKQLTDVKIKLNLTDDLRELIGQKESDNFNVNHVSLIKIQKELPNISVGRSRNAYNGRNVNEECNEKKCFEATGKEGLRKWQELIFNNLEQKKDD